VTATEIDDAAESQAPPVVVAVVTSQAGPWLEECLASVVAQDYPNLSILVIATGAAEDLVSRVAAVAPSAFVRRLEGVEGFGPAANDVLEVVEGASFYAFCHDDVILDTFAVRALVEEAFRSNAGVVGPKLVLWHEPEHLSQGGMGVDNTGVRSPTVERGELDQEQHDAVRDVFLIPGACTLVRADLFKTLGGFDPGIPLLGEDLDLCWRAQIAGARVVVVPAARVQHRESLDDRPPDERRGELEGRHRIRTMLTCYGRLHLARVLPQALVLAIAEIVYAFTSGRRSHAREVVAAGWWNARRIAELRERRRAVRAIRQLPDSEVRRLQLAGSMQVRSYVRGELHTDRLRAAFEEFEHELSDFTAGPQRLVFGAWIFVTLVLLFGTRDLLFHRLPAVGGLAPFDTGVPSLLRNYLNGWRHAGLGAEAPQPTAFALLGLAGIPFLGGMGLLQQVLVLGAFPVGAIGVWRLTRPLGSRLGRSAALLVYAVVPLPYDSLARGSWGGLLLYAAAPWIVARLIAACGDLPSAHGPAIRRRDLRAIVVLGLIIALVAAFVPLVVALVPLIAAALVVGALLTGGSRRVIGALWVALYASGVAVLLHIPWTFDFALPGSEWWSLGGVSPLVKHAVSFGQLVRFDVGDGGQSSLGWALPVAAALPLLIGREWRFAWAVRCWCVALACWAVAWTGGQGLLGVPVPPPEVLLAPAAAALALAVGLGALAFERDLRGYHFGWRQIASAIAGIAVLAGAVPIVIGSIDGRWDVPVNDHSATLSFLRGDDVRKQGGFRVLWLGDPEVLPVAGFRLADDLAYGFSENGPGRLRERWSAPAYGATPLVADALRLAARGDTERLGRMLGPFGVRYLILAARSAPASAHTQERPLPAGLTAAAARQLDLRRIDVDASLILYENTEWVPITATATSADARSFLQRDGALRVPTGADLSDGFSAALNEHTGYTSYRGRVSNSPVLLAESSSTRWRLRVNGHSVSRSRALGWANAFDVSDSGDGTLTYRTSALRWLGVALQVALWGIVIAFLVLTRRREVRIG
jgi:GT2 family glycosyltransferase